MFIGIVLAAGTKIDNTPAGSEIICAKDPFLSDLKIIYFTESKCHKSFFIKKEKPCNEKNRYAGP
jgi:hypothetical protein